MSESPHHKPIRPAKAERHEAITLRCEALLRQVEAVALRQGQKGVPADVERLAVDLLCDANPFLPRRRRAPLPIPAPTYAGLAAELAAARAALEAFELRHTEWDAGLKCIVWRTAGEPLPVARLHPQPLAQPRSATPGHISDIKQKLIDRIEQLKRA